ncbi:MAG TPA: disulfide bond formation protein B [Beijerinckiaceae bacterium]
MSSILHTLTRPRTAAAVILAAAALTVGGALAFEHLGGLVPCKLCLLQRKPYYLALPLAVLALLLPPARRGLLALLALVFVVSTSLGAHHAGVEWGFWPGPSDCGGGAGPAAGGVEDFLKQLDRTRVVSCTEAAWRFLGLSLSGWNGLISLGLAGFAALAASRRAHGSSSVSQ